MKLESILQEILSDKLWHFTKFEAAMSIIKSNEFILGLATGGDHTPDSKGKYYFMSTSRQKNDGYGDGYYCRFELDGRKLSQNYSGKAFNYFKNSSKRDTEFEDRVFSLKPTIPNANKYIKKLELLFNVDDDSAYFTRKCYLLCELCIEHNIDCYIYTSERDYRKSTNGISFKTKEDLKWFNVDSPEVDKIKTNKGIPRVINPVGLAFYIHILMLQGLTEKEIYNLFLNDKENEDNFNADIKHVNWLNDTNYKTYEEYIKNEWKQLDDKIKEIVNDLKNMNHYNTMHSIRTYMFSKDSLREKLTRKLIDLILFNARKDKVKLNDVTEYIYLLTRDHNFKELKDGLTVKIIQIKFPWLLEDEVNFNDAVVGYKDNTLIWYKGEWWKGDWKYGIFKDGVFFGEWNDGIFENGYFEGKWYGGEWKGGDFFGEWLDPNNPKPEKEERIIYTSTEGAKIVYENNRVTVFNISTQEAAFKLGKGTSWGVSREHDNTFESLYSEYGYAIYFIFDTQYDQDDPRHKFCVLIGDGGKFKEIKSKTQQYNKKSNTSYPISYLTDELDLKLSIFKQRKIHVIDELKDGLSMDIIKKKFPWLLEDDVEINNAILGYKNDKLIWYSGAWLKGTWVDGIWENGRFGKGIWKDGIFNGLLFFGEWYGGEWKGGNFFGEWLDPNNPKPEKKI